MIFRCFSTLMIALITVLSIVGCDDVSQDMLSLSNYNISLVDDDEAKAGGYTKVYVSLKDPTFNVEIFRNARAAIDSKDWTTLWINTAIAGKKPIPQVIGFDNQLERDKFINEMNIRSDEGIQWNFEYHEYESEYLSENFDIDIVYSIEFRPVLPDYDNLTPTQIKLMDIYPPFIASSYPAEFGSYDLELLLDDGIEVTFNENVTGDLSLIELDTNSFGEIVETDMGWISNTQGKTITLTKGDNVKSFRNGYAYHVVGSVEDIAGNTTNVYYYFRVYVSESYIVSSSPEDGSHSVDPDQLSKNGITVEFNRPMTGKLTLRYGDYSDMGWTSTIEGNTIKLTRGEGKHLMHEAEYIIDGIVEDEFGSSVFVYISFVTEVLE